MSIFEFQSYFLPIFVFAFSILSSCSGSPCSLVGLGASISFLSIQMFYPDLLDPSKAPTYVLEPAESPEFCIVRFCASAPYEDVAFKIVNKEWEMSHKRGFKCTFERGILHLYFNFRRYRYRR